ncbi:hypothetical protein AAFC00_006954 [Neodothiora populina]|uniref:UBL3-like ubiquitin domain-containing protein n=1 Tax=Neodothiora populina TaxID=2781224 RepID=A0ABR3PC73_9PEZI
MDSTSSNPSQGSSGLPPSASSHTPLEPTVGPISASESSEFPSIAMPQPALVRQDTVEAIGPSTDLPTPLLPTGDLAAKDGHVIIINLLLTSTGTRHPYKIDEKYLSKRGVTAQAPDGTFDPFVISVYTLKELIWRDWREEWEPRPSSPSAIRLIHFGRLLDDKLPLKDCRFSEHAPNVVHMSLKPQDIVDDEDNAKAASKSSIRRGRDSEESEVGCRCVIF